MGGIAGRGRWHPRLQHDHGRLPDAGTGGRHRQAPAAVRASLCRPRLDALLRVQPAGQGRGRGGLERLRRTRPLHRRLQRPPSSALQQGAGGGAGRPRPQGRGLPEALRHHVRAPFLRGCESGVRGGGPGPGGGAWRRVHPRRGARGGALARGGHFLHAALFRNSGSDGAGNAPMPSPSTAWAASAAAICRPTRASPSRG